MYTEEQVAGFYLYDPARTGKLWGQFMAEQKEYPGHRWFSPMDWITDPIRRNDMIMLAARPGHGKTTVSLAQARAMSIAIGTGLVPNHDKTAVVYATVEQTVEEAETIIQASTKYPTNLLIKGEAPEEYVRDQVIKRSKLPLWLIGRSRTGYGKKGPPLDAQAITDSVLHMQNEYGIQPHVLFVDYLQYLPSVERGRQGTRTQVTEAVLFELKEFTLNFGIPIVLTAQLGRHVDDYKEPIGKKGDIQHTSLAEQTIDRFFSFWRPILDAEKGDVAHWIGDKSYVLDHSLLIIAPDKGRFEEVQPQMAVRFHPATLEFGKAREHDVQPVDNGSTRQHKRNWNQSGIFKDVDPIDV